MSTRFDPSKRTHTVVTTVDKTDDKYSHAIPVVPEFPSDTDYNTQFYEGRRAENRRLAGLTIQYVEDGYTPPPLDDIGTATIFGDSVVYDSTAHTYQVTISGSVDIDDCTVVYTTDDPADIVSGDTITFVGDGIRTHVVTATITHPTAPDSPVTATYSVEVKGAPGFDTLETKPSKATGGTISYRQSFSTQLEGLDPGYTTDDYKHFYTVVGSNTTQNSVRVVNSQNEFPYWIYDGNKVINNNTPCVVSEAFKLKTDPSVTLATLNCTFYLRNT